MINALKSSPALPRFSSIEIEKVVDTIKSMMQENTEILSEYLEKSQLENNHEVDWLALKELLETLDNRLSCYWSPISHLNSVMSSDEIRKVHDQCVPLLSAYATEMSQNSQLYNAYKTIADSQSFDQLEQESRKVIENSLLQFELNGVGLSEKKKLEFKAIKQELSTLKTQYEHNVLDATQAFKIHIEDKSQLTGLPDFVRAMAKQNAQEDDMSGWVFTLDAPSYIGVMTYSDIRQFREEMYTAYCTRASQKGPNANEFDNTEIIEKILNKRKQLATLLGYDNYAELSIANKMAETTDDVINFLHQLVDKSRPQAMVEYDTLTLFAKKNCKLQKLEAWDIMYVSEKLKQKEYGISQEALKPYFPANKVIQGMFEIVKRLYGITIKQKTDVDVWHKDVGFYEIVDADNEVRGQFYLDLYARNNKRGGAWMDECMGRMKIDDQIQTPVAYLTCNLTPPVGNTPALLNHEEVTTLFHEFGHGLQHMLTKVEALFVSGISGVEWDAVELPSQFMENWCWEKEGLELISEHYETGEALPENLYRKMLKAKNFQSAMQMVRQLEFGIFDFRLHMETGTDKFENVQSLLNAVRESVAVIIPPDINQFQNSFSHIFAGGYSAGYYSYKWAEVLSADAYSKFEEDGIFNQETGESFLQNILEKGGSVKAIELFKAFRGREPSVDALLKHSGLQH